VTAARPLTVLQPTDMFHCTHLDCDLMGRSCVTRQRARNVSRVWKRSTVPVHLEYCASGKCEQGKEIAAALEGQAISPPKPVDQVSQYRARMRQLRPTYPIAKRKASVNTVDRLQLQRAEEDAARVMDLKESRPLAAEKETAVAAEKTTQPACSMCGKEVRRRNGVLAADCFKCRRKAGDDADAKKPPRAKAQNKAAASKKARTPEARKVLRGLELVAQKHAGPLAFADLPPVDQLPPTYLVECAQELRRIRDLAIEALS
jgi:ribosomal protein L37AE/L43A